MCDARGTAELTAGSAHLKALNTDQLHDKGNNETKTTEYHSRSVILHAAKARHSRWQEDGCAGASESEHGLEQA